MEESAAIFNSGQRAMYEREILPLARKNRRMEKINWVASIGILLVCAISGIVVGFLMLPTFLGIFMGLLGGSLIALALLLAYYFLVGAYVGKNKQAYDDGNKACQDAYLKAYSVPEDAKKGGVVASDYLGSAFFTPSLMFSSTAGELSIIAEDFKYERDALTFSKGNTLSWALLTDSTILAQTQGGYVIVSAEAKDFFLDSAIPNMESDSRLFFEISGRQLSASARKKERIGLASSAGTGDWDAAKRTFEEFANGRNAK